LMFYSTSCFTDSLSSVWKVFLNLSQLDSNSIVKRAYEFSKYIQQVYRENYLVYKHTDEYVDYWKKSEHSVSIGKRLINYDYVPIFFEKNVFRLLHLKEKKKSRNKKKGYFRKRNASVRGRNKGN
jgi:hypothetical protein